MKILITNHALLCWQGSETWTYAMAKELSREHEVTVLSPFLGEVADKIGEFAKVIDNFEGEYDLAICNHTNIYCQVPKDIFRIFTSHSFFIDIEQFPDDANALVGVTEETAKGNQVIRNGIDCERFKNSPVSDELKNILYLSHPMYNGALQVIQEACRGYNLDYLQTEDNQIEKRIEKADLVITLGRGILESMASGKNVISCDQRKGWMSKASGAGMITEENFDFYKTHAFSGRNEPKEFTPETLRQEIEKYDPKRNLRHRILEEFNIQKTAKEYLNIFYGHLSGKIS